MKNTVELVCVMVLLLSLLASTPQLGAIKTVEASIAANFLPNNCSRIDTQTELDLSLDVAEYITTTLANYGSTSGCYYSYEEDCTVSSYCNILSTLKNYYDKSIVFSKGHRGYPYYPNTNHSSLLDYYGDNVTDIGDIYPRT